MNCRRHGSKPTLALWMLVAVADVAILAAAAGPLGLVLSAVGILVVAAAVVAVRMQPGRAAALLPNRAAVKTEAVARRRA
jgi:hypothetical protein